MKKILIATLAIATLLFSLTMQSVEAAENCGQTVTFQDDCNCTTNNNRSEKMFPGMYCCGYFNGICKTTQDSSTFTCGEKLASSTVPDGVTCACPGAQWESYKVFGFRNICCGFVQDNDFIDQCLTANPSETTAFCGTIYQKGEKECICGGGGGESLMASQKDEGSTVCCGWLRNGTCQSTDVGINDVKVTKQTLNSLNPLMIGGSTADLATPGAIISRALQFFIFPIAGIILFIVLLLGGFQMLTGATNSKSLEEGKQRITAALIGFMLLFASYWIAQLLELIFGIRILS